MQDQLDVMQVDFDQATAKKQALTESADAIRTKISAASDLISRLGGETVRWGEQLTEFTSSEERLVLSFFVIIFDILFFYFYLFK